MSAIAVQVQGKRELGNVPVIDAVALNARTARPLGEVACVLADAVGEIWNARAHRKCIFSPPFQGGVAPKAAGWFVLRLPLTACFAGTPPLARVERLDAMSIEPGSSVPQFQHARTDFVGIGRVGRERQVALQVLKRGAEALELEIEQTAVAYLDRIRRRQSD